MDEQIKFKDGISFGGSIIISVKSNILIIRVIRKVARQFIFNPVNICRTKFYLNFVYVEFHLHINCNSVVRTYITDVIIYPTKEITKEQIWQV